MSRAIYCLVLIVLMAGALLSGCAQPAAPGPTSTRISFDKQELPKFVVGFAGQGGLSWIQVSAVAEMVNKYTPIKATMTVIAGIKDAVEPMRRGEVDYASLTPTEPWLAYSGVYEAEGVKKIQMRILLSPARTGKSTQGIWVLSSSNIKNGADLKGKRIGVQPRTTWTKHLAQGLIQAHGWTDKDYTLVDYADMPSGFGALVERRIDAFVAIPGSESLELSKSVGLRYLPFTKEETDAMRKVNPTFLGGMTPVNYMGTGESQWGILSFSAYWIRVGASEKTAYTMLKAVLDNVDVFHRIHERMLDYELQGALGVPSALPYHPGVVRYYQQMGIWKPEHTALQKSLLEQERKLYGYVIDEAAFKELGILP